ncbi:MAG TPA: metallophosphoesterase [Polyangiaceae bacterium]|nr:metallophosphoesterase [Polyangiaceae bacterium]
MLKTTGSLLNLILLTGACATITACSGAEEGRQTSPSADETAAKDSGKVGLALQVTQGVVLNTVSYSITGPHSYSGSIDVSNSTRLSALIGNIAAGTGYTLSLTGTATDGTTTCGGTSGSFSVTAGQTTTVAVSVDCHVAPTTGSVLVNGSVNVCPSVGAVSANPPNGLQIAISSTATDPDGGPSPITYAWTTSSGTLSSATAPNPTLTCTAPGNVSLTLTVSDGDAGCASTFDLTVACPDDSSDPMWVELGAGGQAIARVITPYNACPAITVDGTSSAMNLRVGPATEPLRPTSSDPTVNPMSTTSKPSVFNVTTCEYDIPSTAHSASIAGKKLPLPKADVERVVIIGDTGCRVSNGNPFQNCSEPTQWPFNVLSQAGAAMNPDLVLHVGDYEYRDNACPDASLGCSGPWGYGYDAWAADFFTPAAPLLAAAPWVMVRGNHETCNRAGQGWYRFLDTNPYSDTKSCNDPANDDAGNYNAPFAVPFDDTQFVVFDSANVSKSALSPQTKPADVVPFNNYQSELQTAATFTANSSLLSIFAVHHPLLGYTPGTPVTGGNPALLSVMSATYPTAYYPPGVGLALHGHVHDYQAINFASGHPSTFVAGNGGDNLDVQLPDPLPIPPATGTVIDKVAHSASFGFMVMDRVGSQQWKFTAFRRDGSILDVCTMVTTPFSGSGDPTPGRQISCTNTGLLM